MFETRIAAAPLTLETCAGFPAQLDALAAAAAPGRRFLRAEWFRAGAAGEGRTLLVRRADGTPLAAIPTDRFGPAPLVAAGLGARKVPGSYWPFRGIALAADADIFELAEALGRREARSLGPVWRLGPVRGDDPATRLLVEAARLAGWQVLSRHAGTAFLVDCAALRAAGWPKSSTARRLRTAWRKLAERGTPDWRHVRGAAWSAAVLEELGAVEANSWIARRTDGSGAKFLRPRQRALWQAALADPVLAEMLCATILTLDGRAVAFSFDLDDGPVQYGIAGSYDEALADCNIGKLVNYKALEDAIADGQAVMDLGAGDSGYKSAMGAAEGYDFEDLLFVRSRTAARLLAGLWATSPAAAQDPSGRHG